MWTFTGGCERSSGSSLANPYTCAPTEPTAAKARPATGTLVILSVVSQTLNLGRFHWRCNAMFHYKEDFSISSLIIRPLKLSCGFFPTSVCIWSLLQCLLEHMRLSARNKLSQQMGQAGHQERGFWHSD